MIIRDHGSPAVLITQPDHARLARQMMSPFTSRGFATADRRDSILYAIEEHDNGWREVDAAPLVGDDGRLLDFVSAPAEVRQAIWPRGVHRLAADPVAQHAVTIYARFRSDPAWTRFFSDMEQIRDRFLMEAGLAAHALARDYFFVRLADLMSLAFCTTATEPQALEDHVITLAGATLIVAPDPFAGATVPIEVPGRRLQRVSFASRAAAAQAFDEAERITITGTARGEPLRPGRNPR